MFVKHSATKKLNLDSGHYSGATPFIVACEENCIDVVKEFLEHSDINFNARNNWGQTAFMKACMIGHVEIVKLLWKYKDDKIDVTATDHKGRNVIELIADRDHQEIEEILKSHFKNLKLIILEQKLKPFPSLVLNSASVENIE